jgi:hypothetical protein
MSRFVRPQTKTITLANGDQLIVRERLTAGEARAQFARMYVSNGDGGWHRNPTMLGLGPILAYLLDWTLTDDAGSRVEIRDLSPADLLQVIDSLDTESLNEIRTAIEAHEAAMTTERDQEKKTAGGTPS